MKFYATITTERDSRPAKKGSDKGMEIELTHKNTRIGTIEVRGVAANGFIVKWHAREFNGDSSERILAESENLHT